MMKAVVLCVFIACASALEFNVKDGSGEICAQITLNGSVYIEASKGAEQVGNMTLQFDDNVRLLPSSKCDSLKLGFDSKTTVQVWFDQQAEGDNFKVVPISTFNPKAAFQINVTTSPTFSGDAIGSYGANQSYSCAAPGPMDLKQNSPVTDYTFTVTLTLSNFKVQYGGIENGSYSPGPDCKDPTTTPTPTTPTTPSTASPGTTTPLPSPPTLHLNVTNDGVECTKLDGSFKLAVLYQDKDKKNQTYTTIVPDSAVASGNCNATTNTSTMDVSFDVAALQSTWVLSYTFMKDGGSNYHISEIKLNYANLPNAQSSAPKEASAMMGSDYLKAATTGYYTCMASQDVDIQEVTLTSTDFKYRAFNDKGTIDFSGDVSECSADDDTNSIVPIAVGAALAGLVVIVLIAYLIGRRRSRKSGYESV